MRVIDEMKEEEEKVAELGMVELCVETGRWFGVKNRNAGTIEREKKKKLEEFMSQRTEVSRV